MPDPITHSPKVTSFKMHYVLYITCLLSDSILIYSLIKMLYFCAFWGEYARRWLSSASVLFSEHAQCPGRSMERGEWVSEKRGGGGSVSKETGIQGFTLQPLCYAIGLLPWRCPRGWVEGRRGKSSPRLRTTYRGSADTSDHEQTKTDVKESNASWCQCWRDGRQTTLTGQCAASESVCCRIRGFLHGAI